MTAFSLLSRRSGQGRASPVRLAAALAVALVVAASSLAPTAAQAQVSTTAVPFLRIEPDSRAAGMGNTGVALADDANAIWWNPAGLGFQEGAEIGITHSNWLPEFDAGLYFDYLVGKYHVDGIGTFGGHVAFMNLGSHERRNNQNQQVGEFRSFDLATGLSYGVKLGNRFSIGTGARAIYSQLDGGSGENNLDGTAFAFGVDLAALYRTRPFSLGDVETTVSAGANLSNMGPKIDYDENTPDQDPLPQHLRFGAASTFVFDQYNELTLAVDFGKLLTNTETEQVENDDGESETRRQVDPFYEAIFSAWGSKDKIGPDGDPTGQISPLQQVTVGGGLEYWYSQLFALRTGYYYENPDFGDRQFLNFGAGLRYNIIGVDFSYIFPFDGDDPLANTIRISLLVDIPSASSGAGSSVAE